MRSRGENCESKKKAYAVAPRCLWRLPKAGRAMLAASPAPGDPFARRQRRRTPSPRGVRHPAFVFAVIEARARSRASARRDRRDCHWRRWPPKKFGFRATRQGLASASTARRAHAVASAAAATAATTALQQLRNARTPHSLEPSANSFTRTRRVSVDTGRRAEGSVALEPATAACPPRSRCASRIARDAGAVPRSLPAMHGASWEMVRGALPLEVRKAR